MKYLFDLSHPAHFHLFKNMARSLLHRGDKVVFAVKQKDVLIDLVKADPDFHKSVYVKTEVEKAKGLLADLSWLVINDLTVLKLCRQYKPDAIFTTTKPLFILQYRR